MELHLFRHLLRLPKKVYFNARVDRPLKVVRISCWKLLRKRQMSHHSWLFLPTDFSHFHKRIQPGIVTCCRRLKAPQSLDSGDDDGVLCGLEEFAGKRLDITDSVVVSPAAKVPPANKPSTSRYNFQV